MTCNRRWVPVLLVVMAVTLAQARRAIAQVERLTVRVAQEHVGLGGVVRPGTWTPMRVTIDNPSPEPRRVAVQWSVSDSDGDTVLAQRIATLSPQRTQAVWLYANPPLSTIDTTTWQVTIFEWSGTSLGRRLTDPLPVRPGKLLAMDRRAIALTTSSHLGLDPFEDDVTQHEKCEFLRGLSPLMLPDRWHGLSMVEAIIWTSEGGDPGDPSVPTEAIRQWVRRGGHLVIVLPSGLNPWPQSPLASMLPELTIDRVESVKPPGWLGKTRPDLIDYYRLQPTPGSKATVVLEDDQTRPVCVAAPYGFGRVTLLGLDLTNPKITGMWVPWAEKNLWNTIFRWQTPAWRKSYVEAELNASPPRFQRPMFSQTNELGRFIPAQVSRAQTIAAALLLAMLIFAAYWLAAGPIGFTVLKGRGLVRHAWLGFITVIGVFTVITWGGAMLMRPTTAAISHLTVLDIDATTRLTHARSWMSMFVPEHDAVELIIDPDTPDGAGHLWSSPGFDPERPESGFVDRQSYVVDAAMPARRPPDVSADGREPLGPLVPMRATTKSLMVDYLGPLQHDSPWLGTNWVMPVGEVKVVNHVPVGKLRHGLPGTLRNTLLVYCPGGEHAPQVVDYGDWAADRDLIIDNSTRRVPLISSPRPNVNETWGGLLGQLVKEKVGHQPEEPQHFGMGQPDEGKPKPLNASLLVRHLWMLSFFGTLPPPEYQVKDQSMMSFRPPNYSRAIGRDIDLTALTGLRRLIIIGMIENSPLPVPLSVDGRRLEADGWTVVRWHMDLE